MNRAIARPSSRTVVTLEPACHAGGRGFESRRSRKVLQIGMFVAALGVIDRRLLFIPRGSRARIGL